MSEPATAAVQVPKAAELVAAQLRRQIVLGERAEGEMLPPETELTAELGVSRPTLRQALRILENELLVTVQRGRRGGTRVNRPSAEVAGRYLGNVLLHQRVALDDVHTARLLLEPAAVARLAGTLPAVELARLRDLVERNRAETDPARLRELGGRFHTELVGLTGNPAVTLFQQLVQQLIDAHTARFESQRLRTREPSRSAELIDAHARVLDLLEAGAAQEAARCWHDHLTAVHARLGTAVDAADLLDLEI